MEETENKGLRRTMQSDTSPHDSALKWWDGCEANTVPFNEGSLFGSLLLSFLPTPAPPRLSHFLLSLSLSPSFFPNDWMKVASVHGTKRCVSCALSEVRAGQMCDPLITVRHGW